MKSDSSHKESEMTVVRAFVGSGEVQVGLDRIVIIFPDGREISQPVDTRWLRDAIEERRTETMSQAMVHCPNPGAVQFFFGEHELAVSRNELLGALR